MSEMIERVARVLFKDLRDRRGIKNAILRHEGLDHEAGFEDNRDWLTEVASTAIQAMREPTEAMYEAYSSRCSLGGDLIPQPDDPVDMMPLPAMVTGAWRAMIDEALK